MPFVDEEKLAELYKEMDKESKSSVYFQSLYFKYKAKLTQLVVYKYGFYTIASLFIALLFFTLYPWPDKPTPATVDNEIDLSNQVDQLENENKVLNGQTIDINNILEDKTVYTVQFIASKKKDILLFSENFINFRAYPLHDSYAYSLGNFVTKEEAESFKQELIKLGLSDLWITSYKSGERILLENQ